jgi:hypothetical protein
MALHQYHRRGSHCGSAGHGDLVVGQSRVPSEAIASSVTRTPELIERAWHLPVAATFHEYVNGRSNGSPCGPAAVANAYRSLGEAASTEGKVLAGTGRCWTGVCMRTCPAPMIRSGATSSISQFRSHTKFWCWCRTSLMRVVDFPSCRSGMDSGKSVGGRHATDCAVARSARHVRVRATLC